MIVAGIDEAGYGPLLGPLVVALTSFEAPPGRGADLWRALAGAVSRTPAADRARGLPVVDSKALLGAARTGFAALETVALAFSGFAAGGDQDAPAAPLTAARFLDRHGVAGAAARLPLERYPWYREHLGSLLLPLAAEPEPIAAARRRLAGAARAAGVTAVRVAVRPLLEAEFNEQAAAAGSKALVLFRLNAALMDDLLARRRPDRIICDRHGGRRHYRALLESAFPLAGVRVVEERRERSVYTVFGDAMEVCWLVAGERHAFEVALASIFAKYARELFVECINRFFARRLPGLRRTAGYYQDGRRFLCDLEDAGVLARGERGLLVRQR